MEHPPVKRSDTGGRVARRPVQVRYWLSRRDSPGGTGRDGVVLLLGVDHGTSDWYYSWEVPHEVYQDLPDSTPVDAAAVRISTR